MRLKQLEGATIKVNRDCFLGSPPRDHGNLFIHGRRVSKGDTVTGYTGPFNPKWMDLIADPVGDQKRQDAEDARIAREEKAKAEKEAFEKAEIERQAKEAAAEAQRKKAEAAEKAETEEPPVPPEPDDFEDEDPDEEVPAHAVVETTATRRRGRPRKAV